MATCLDVIYIINPTRFMSKCCVVAVVKSLSVQGSKMEDYK